MAKKKKQPKSDRDVITEAVLAAANKRLDTMSGDEMKTEVDRMAAQPVMGGPWLGRMGGDVGNVPPPPNDNQMEEYMRKMGGDVGVSFRPREEYMRRMGGDVGNVGMPYGRNPPNDNQMEEYLRRMGGDAGNVMFQPPPGPAQEILKGVAGKPKGKKPKGKAEPYRKESFFEQLFEPTQRYPHQDPILPSFHGPRDIVWGYENPSWAGHERAIHDLRKFPPKKDQ